MQATRHGYLIEHLTGLVRYKHVFIEPITSGSAKQDGNEIEHPNDFVRNKQPFIEEEEIYGACT